MRDAYGRELSVGDTVSVATRKPVMWQEATKYHGARYALRLSQYKAVVHELTGKSIGVRLMDSKYADSRTVFVSDTEWFSPRQVVKL